MTRNQMAIAAVAAAVIVAGGAFYAGRQSTSAGHIRVGVRAGSTCRAGERKVLYWHDPMVPGPRFDKPGKSPFMDMQLVPVYADEAERLRREGQPAGAAEPGHPHGNSYAHAGGEHLRRGGQRCSSTSA